MRSSPAGGRVAVRLIRDNQNHRRRSGQTNARVHRGGGSAVVALRSCAQTRPAPATAIGTLTLRGAAFARSDSRGDRVMETLTQMKCVACRKDAPTVTDAELAEFHRQVSDWDIVELDGI